MRKKYYLDDAASTRVSEEVVKEMRRYFLEEYGNASSSHLMGERAFRAISEARKKIASEIAAKPQEIVFTSGATESNNMALKGLLKLGKKKIIISAVEHPSVNVVANFLEESGNEVLRIGVDERGFVDIDKLREVIDDNTALVSVIHAHNVFGTIQDIGVIGKICKEKGVLFHTDAVQSFGKLKIDVGKMGIDMLSASGHKIGGPKGIGFLYVREGVELEPMIHGGGQERGMRGGTEDVPGIVGFAKALELCKEIDNEKIIKIRDKLISRLEEIGGKIIGTRGEERVFNNVNVTFSGVDNVTLVTFLSEKGIYVSAGSACGGKKEKEDSILKALGLSELEKNGVIRISFNFDFREKDIGVVVEEIKRAVEVLKG
jgi:cysteine desulfurase